MVWIFSLFLLLFSACTYTEGGDIGEKSLRITAIDVGQGLAVLFEYNNHFGLYDTGEDSTGFLDTLKNRNIQNLDWVILSHNHRDHVGGFLEFPKVLKSNIKEDYKLSIKKIFVSPDTGGGAFRDSVIYIGGRFSIPIDTLYRGDVVQFEDNSPEFRVVWPPENSLVSGNHSSITLNVEWGIGSALFTGDLDSLGEHALLELSPHLKTELLQVGHHGSPSSSSLKFLSQIMPNYGFISVGKNNSYGHPAVSVQKKLQYVLGDSLRIYRTDKLGSLSFEMNPKLGVIPLFSN